MSNYGFLFGAGAEIGYGLPSGGKFALDIFRHDTSNGKNVFKQYRDSIDPTTKYASTWLPNNYKTKSVTIFGKTVFQNIIKNTIEQRKTEIIDCINNIDNLASKVANDFNKIYDTDIKEIFDKCLDKDIDELNLKQVISYISEFENGDKLFENSFFASILMLYNKKNFFNTESKNEIQKIILSILQLQIGALGEELTRKINDGVFQKKDNSIDLLDELGDIFQIDYSYSGLIGLEYLFDTNKEYLYNNDNSFECSDEKYIVLFARELLVDLYSSILDYKSLIDSNWRYLYSPSKDWGKFTKMCIFLYTVNDYIEKSANGIDFTNANGYYNSLKKAIDEEAFSVSAIATTNYNSFIEDVLDKDVYFLNGSTKIWYDPYLNIIGEKEELEKNEKHILVPLLFTQSGTKPMTSIDVSVKYVDVYRKWKESDEIVSVGFGFNTDDEHINGILRTLVDRDDKKLLIVELDRNDNNENRKKQILNNLKVCKKCNVKFMLVDDKGIAVNNGKKWIENLKWEEV